MRYSCSKRNKTVAVNDIVKVNKYVESVNSLHITFGVGTLIKVEGVIASVRITGGDAYTMDTLIDVNMGYITRWELEDRI